MEAVHSLSNGSGGWENVQLMGSVYGAYPCHVRVDPGEYVSVGLQYFLQSGPFLFGEEGANVGAFFRAIYEQLSMDCRGSTANCSLSSGVARVAGLNCYDEW